MILLSAVPLILFVLVQGGRLVPQHGGHLLHAARHVYGKAIGSPLVHSSRHHLRIHSSNETGVSAAVKMEDWVRESAAVQARFMETSRRFHAHKVQPFTAIKELGNAALESVDEDWAIGQGYANKAGDGKALLAESSLLEEKDHFNVGDEEYWVAFQSADAHSAALRNSFTLFYHDRDVHEIALKKWWEVQRDQGKGEVKAHFKRNAAEAREETGISKAELDGLQKKQYDDKMNRWYNKALGAVSNFTKKDHADHDEKSLAFAEAHIESLIGVFTFVLQKEAINAYENANPRSIGPPKFTVPLTDIAQMSQGPNQAMLTGFADMLVLLHLAASRFNCEPVHKNGSPSDKDVTLCMDKGADHNTLYTIKRPDNATDTKRPTFRLTFVMVRKFNNEPPCHITSQNHLPADYTWPEDRLNIVMCDKHLKTSPKPLLFLKTQEGKPVYRLATKDGLMMYPKVHGLAESVDQLPPADQSLLKHEWAFCPLCDLHIHQQGAAAHGGKPAHHSLIQRERRAIVPSLHHGNSFGQLLSMTDAPIKCKGHSECGPSQMCLAIPDKKAKTFDAKTADWEHFDWSGFHQCSHPSSSPCFCQRVHQCSKVALPLMVGSEVDDDGDNFCVSEVNEINPTTKMAKVLECKQCQYSGGRYPVCAALGEQSLGTHWTIEDVPESDPKKRELFQWSSRVTTQRAVAKDGWWMPYRLQTPPQDPNSLMAYHHHPDAFIDCKSPIHHHHHHHHKGHTRTA
ncbi:unnamed protein product [Vitrella brassicaformis CCMP3155]|uniref:Uncharacterized protein n=1 Tax=Vitrella brassicaformis (strain CCMP3155) TaxID=1169540 RepID=A0A0G4GMC5_VITBC|nr:unnamed protein product [Vitrella brassicaformis CCMP3155]|eukprot:CEM31340.1 unnamed protein product [Vitrella brassicaformis CCMP3155]